MKVPVKKPKDVDHFLDCLTAVRTEKKKAANLLFEEIEGDVLQKERFVVE